jgi:hypothetical protein
MVIIKLFLLILSLNQPNAAGQQQSFVQRYATDENNVTNRLPHRSYTKPRFPINIVVGLPAQEGNILRNPFRLTIYKAMPVFDIATGDVYNKQLLPPDSLRITYEDTELSDAIGPQRFVDRYCSKTVDCVMGLAYVFALAPIARMSQYWENGVPVFTTSAMVDELGDKTSFPLLTRLMGTYRTLALMVFRVVEEFKWRRFHFFFNDQAVHGSSQGRSECFFSLNAIKNVFNRETNIEWTVKMFGEKSTSRAEFTVLLKEASMLTNSNIFEPRIKLTNDTVGFDNLILLLNLGHACNKSLSFFAERNLKRH